jgi:hypothetical protein
MNKYSGKRDLGRDRNVTGCKIVQNILKYNGALNTLLLNSKMTLYNMLQGESHCVGGTVC